MLCCTSPPLFLQLDWFSSFKVFSEHSFSIFWLILLPFLEPSYLVEKSSIRVWQQYSRGSLARTITVGQLFTLAWTLILVSSLAYVSFTESSCRFHIDMETDPPKTSFVLYGPDSCKFLWIVWQHLACLWPSLLSAGNGIKDRKSSGCQLQMCILVHGSLNAGNWYTGQKYLALLSCGYLLLAERFLYMT